MTRLCHKLGICDAMWRGRIWVIANHNQPIANNCTSQFWHRTILCGARPLPGPRESFSIHCIVRCKVTANQILICLTFCCLTKHRASVRDPCWGWSQEHRGNKQWQATRPSVTTQHQWRRVSPGGNYLAICSEHCSQRPGWRVMTVRRIMMMRHDMMQNSTWGEN